ncbi:taste receptor type 2 member 102 [Xenopus laevis]|uniref:Taste receptor type 2 n=2 Tax=Xenopus laevis TaxID=8355 RepID=A0A8J0V934_XENLA|nr:taste receptor type 2 member 102 [Xenopus laevis]
MGTDIESKQDVYNMYWAIFCGIIIATGLVVNAFITLVNIIDWSRERSLKLCDKVLSVLCLTRFLLLWFFLLELIGGFMQLIHFSAFGTFCIFYIFELSLDYFSRWLAMWLSVLYYVMITISKHALVLRLKSRIPMITRYILGGSMLISILAATSFSLSGEEYPCVQNTGTNVTGNVTSQFTQPFILTSVFLGQCLPYMIEIISSLYLLCTLFIHVKRRVSSASSPNMDAHWSVMRYILVLNLLSMCNFLGNLSIWFWMSYNDLLGISLGYILVYSYPVLHSIVFIPSNSKLKREIRHLFHCTKLFCCSMKDQLDSRAQTVPQRSV